MRSDEQMVLDPVLYSAIPGGRDAPVEHQLKIAKLLFREEVLGDARVRLCFQATFFDVPGVARRRFQAQIVPAVHGPAVEKQYPAAALLVPGQSVWGLEIGRATCP